MNFRRPIFFIHVVLSLIVLRLTSFFKVSYIIGSKMAFFSATDLVFPVMGAFSGATFILSLFTLRIFTAGINPLLFALKHLPTLTGSLYWSHNSIITRVIIPLLCITLFIVHPVGLQAYAYSFYWLIPIMVYVVKTESVIAQALGATFVTHGVGSIIWLYTVPMTAMQWWGLIPIVAVERTVSVIGMVIVYHMYNLVSVYIKKALFTKTLQYD